MIEVTFLLVQLASLEPMDAYDDWNILENKSWNQRKELCRSCFDHGHFAPPCRTLMETRRSDEHGSVRILRTHEYPENWGDIEAEEVERMVVFCMLLHMAGKTLSHVCGVGESFEIVVADGSRPALDCSKHHGIARKMAKPTGVGDCSIKDDLARRAVQSQREVRNSQNASFVGGLRNARGAVMTSCSLRKVGARVQQVPA